MMALSLKQSKLEEIGLHHHLNLNQSSPKVVISLIVRILASMQIKLKVSFLKFAKRQQIFNDKKLKTALVLVKNQCKQANWADYLL